MYKMADVYIGTDYDKNVSLKRYEYDSGRISWEFRDRLGYPSNPTQEEAEMIIRRWKLVKVEA